MQAGEDSAADPASDPSFGPQPVFHRQGSKPQTLNPKPKAQDRTLNPKPKALIKGFQDSRVWGFGRFWNAQWRPAPSKEAWRAQPVTDGQASLLKSKLEER